MPHPPGRSATGGKRLADRSDERIRRQQLGNRGWRQIATQTHTGPVLGGDVVSAGGQPPSVRSIPEHDEEAAVLADMHLVDGIGGAGLYERAHLDPGLSADDDTEVGANSIGHRAVIDPGDVGHVDHEGLA